MGKLIALLVEEGDDISSLEVPTEEAAPSELSKQTEPDKKADASPSASAPAGPKHTSHIHVEGPVFPSVARLINEAGIKDYKKIKGTGVRGMLTKGDVLAYMGKASSPTGTYKKAAAAPTPGTQAGTAGAAGPARKEIKVRTTTTDSALY